MPSWDVVASDLSGRAIWSDGALAAQVDDPNDAAPPNGAMQYPKLVKGVDTGLAVVAIVLIAYTYYLLISHTTSTGSNCKLPTKALEANLQSILEETWLGKVNNPIFLESESEDCQTKQDFRNKPPYRQMKASRRLLYISRDSDSTHTVRGLEQCPSPNALPGYPKPLSLIRTESSAIKNAINLAIWEWVSLWLVVIMVVITAIYNGFVTGDANSDRFPRLALMIAYAVAFLIHFTYTWTCFCRVYTCLVLNGCWTLLGNAHFGVSRSTANNSDSELFASKTSSLRRSQWGRSQWGRSQWGSDTVRRLSSSNVYDVSLLGPTRVIHTYVSAPEIRLNGVKEIKGDINETQKGIRSMQEAEIKNFERASEGAMDRILFNATLLLSISVVTAFSTWTQSQLHDATSTQLGSLALLVSTASGVGAMLSSALHLSNMKSSPWRFLRMTELIICGKTRLDEDNPDIGFTKTDALRKGRRAVSIWDLFWTVQLSHIPGALVFGPAYVLLSSPNDNSPLCPGLGVQPTITLGGSQIIFEPNNVDGEIKLSVYKQARAAQPQDTGGANDYQEKDNPDAEENRFYGNTHEGDGTGQLQNDNPDAQEGESSGHS